MTGLDRQEIRRAAALIRDGDLVAMPTETVYGLAGDATNDRAVARIFEAKGRPRFNPLIIHLARREDVENHAVLPPSANRLAEAFWPGPLTLVLPRRAESPLSLLVSAGLDTVALRIPAAPLARALIEEAGRPLAAPSANRSGAISPTRAEHVHRSLGSRVGMILDGGPCPVGVESTIVKIDGGGATLLRPGGAPVQEIERVLGHAVRRASARSTIEAPGMLVSHYAPKARLRLEAAQAEANEAFLAFGPAPDRPYSLNLSERGDLTEAAANLFAHLHALDALVEAENLTGIAVANIPGRGLGEAINDRLARAAAPRNA